MASIRKRGNRWQVQVRRKGSPPLSRSFLLKTDAQAWARQMEIQADRSDLAPNTALLTQLTVGDIVRRYLTEVVPRKRSGKNEASVLHAFLRHKLALTALAEISSADFAAYRDERLASVKGATVRREFVTLGERLTDKELEAIYKEDEARYKKKIPPGFRDASKQDADVYGDLVIWKAMLSKAKGDQCPIIFVTDDLKDDWWHEFKGEKVGPRPELSEEFRWETRQAFYMYS